MAQERMEDPLTRELLEYVAQEEPWHIVCAVFHHRFPSPEAFIQTIFELRNRRLITISPERGTDVDATPEALLRDAEAQNFYEDVDWPEGPVWNLLATDAGYELVAD
jgi:hypothetical protein